MRRTFAVALSLSILVFTLLILFSDVNQRHDLELLASADNYILPPDSFQSPEYCGICHNEIYEAWSGSTHAYSWVDVLFQAEYKMAHEDTNGLTDAFCGSCHTPIGVWTGLVPPHDGSEMDDISKRGISCDFCHSIVAVDHVVNAALQVSPGDIKYGPKEESMAPHGFAYSELHRSAEICGTCHNVNHPLNDLPLETTYTEWKGGPYAEEGVICQDCHMTPTPGVTKNPGMAARVGPEHEHVATHFFVGGNYFLSSLLGEELQAQKAVERLQAAADMEVFAHFASPSQLDLEVAITNVGAGHMLPTGLTNVRKMWLEVTLFNEAGEILFLSGHEDEGNRIQEDTQFFHTVFANASGEKTDKVWEAESVLLDRRIPPKETVTESYAISVEEGEVDWIQVRLLYRSAPQYLLDEILEDPPLVPSVEMLSNNLYLK